MDGKTRRQEIIRILTQASGPISGSTLATSFGVSRQVIVQDIALLRTEHPILATAQGYLLYTHPARSFRRAFLVKHSYEEIYDELSAIVTLGGRVLDVTVEHDVYGELRADLNLSTLEDIQHFCNLLARSKSGPLFPISAGIHLHTVEAASEGILTQIEETLQSRGYLLPPLPSRD
ncbi:MAG: transcription repressor NadR [Lachnospiraceae bacterium]|jgi:transcriptional regulator of NAD metabolism|nr:transcription repressor NadR [Lachnospiraceae bacterium]